MPEGAPQLPNPESVSQGPTEQHLRAFSEGLHMRIAPFHFTIAEEFGDGEIAIVEEHDQALADVNDWYGTNFTLEQLIGRPDPRKAAEQPDDPEA
jgi:hypothetical protein